MPGFSAMATTSNVNAPPVPRWWSTAVAMMPTSMNADPSIVNRKNLVAAYTRSPWPHCPMMKYIGTSTISKQMKKRKRSSERKVPMQPASSNSIQAM